MKLASTSRHIHYHRLINHSHPTDTFTNLVRRPPRPDLLLANLAQLVHRRRLPRDGALRHIGNLANNVLGRNGIVSGRHLDADDTDAGVLRAAVMDAVAQITEPGLELGAVVLLDQVAVRDDAGGAAD